jgi:hypothetical protein
MLFECGVVFVVFRQYVVRPSQANEDDGGGAGLGGWTFI